MKRLLLAVLLLAPTSARADAVFENARMRLVVDAAGRCASLVERGTGRVLLAAEKLPAAAVTVAGKSYPCAGASLDAGRLALRFAGVDTVLHVAVQAEPEWILFRLESIAGARPDRLTLLQLPVAITANVGTRLDIAWDERTSVCLMAAGRQAECRASRGAGAALLTAAGQDAPGPRLEGTAAALIVAPTPGVRAVLRRASHAFGLPLNESPAGVPSKETEDARGAYWFLDVRQDDAPRVIEYCRQSGIRQVLISSGSWCASPGHYLFNTRSFPDGEAGLKRLVAALHAAGIKVSMHCFVSKVAKVDPYVTPRPDRRFWVDRQATLADAVTAGQTEIRTASDLREWPGSPVAKQKVWEGGVAKHREVILDDEIVCYDAIGPEGKWDTFQGCKRGAWGTAPAAHAAGAGARHYGVDGCINGYIIDQETGLLDEAAERIAGIFNRCDFDGVYFDGGEDVDTRRFNYYVSRFQEAAMKRFRKRPVIHMGTIMTHLLWHSFTRSATVDTYLNTLNGAIIAGAPVDKWPTVREHIDRSVAYMLSVRQDLMPGELGWFGIWPRGKNTDGLQLDEFEYLMAKSLAYDAPVSLQTSFRQMESHPLTPGLLEIFRVYDALRMRRAVPAATREMLARKGQDYALVGGPTKPQFVPVVPAPSVAGGKEARACVGETAGGALVTLWHTAGDAELLVDFPPQPPARGGSNIQPPARGGSDAQPPARGGSRVGARAEDIEGRPLPVRAESGKLLVPIGTSRLALFLPGVSAKQAEALLAGAQLRVKPPTLIRIEAENCTRIVGAMARGSALGIREPEASGDVILPTGAASPAQPHEWYCEYTADVPHDGKWTLWARVRYPSQADDSFGILLPGEKVTLGQEQVLGNCGQNAGKWHWTGRGGGSTTPPPGDPIRLALKKGPFTFRVYARESSGLPATAPRLDALCLSDGVGEPGP